MPLNIEIPLDPERVRKLEFQGKAIDTADLKDGQGYIAIKSLCEAFGINPRGQQQRLLRKRSYFEPYLAYINMPTAKGARATLCLMASTVPLFLTGINLEQIENEKSRKTMRVFLEEAHIVLAEHFGISERGEIQFLRESIARMAAEQEAFEEQISKKVDAELSEIRQAHDEKVQQIREAFKNLRQEFIHTAGPKERLTPEQRGQLREIVHTLGVLMQEQGVTKPYPGIYMDITRLSGVSKVEHIKQEDFPEVVRFLERQVQALLKKPGKKG